MRAILDKDISEKILINDHIEIQGSRAHHLLNVARVKSGEELLILNGKGLLVGVQIKNISKKEVILCVQSIERVEQTPWVDLVICIPKRDAFEKIIKIAVELGVTNIFPAVSKYSQKNIIRSDRLDKIIESAIIQSNNPYCPIVKNVISFDELLKLVLNYDEVFLFSTRDKNGKFDTKIKKKKLIIIGPEGGFSSSEEDEICSLKNVSFIHLNIPIMRSTTATGVALGYILGRIDTMSKKA